MPQSVSLIESLPREKWLNIVLDLNGILCQCVDELQIPRFGHLNFVGSHLFSLYVPTRIGPKSMYTCPRLHKFLVEVTDIPDGVVMYSSMKRASVEQIVVFLFMRLKLPFNI